MPARLTGTRLIRGQGARVLYAQGAGLALLLALGGSTASPPPAAPVKIAVFNFELQDDSPSAVLLHQSASRSAILDKATSEARQELVQSGRYSLVDVSKADAQAVRDGTLRNCNGCEAEIARQLGAEQSLVGIVRPITQTDYYVLVSIRDARNGKVLDLQEANFAGDDSGWPSGVRMLIKHQVLVTPN